MADVIIADRVLSGDDLRWKHYCRVRFERCTFQGTYYGCNFADAEFVDCTFALDLAFERCLLAGSTGLPVRFQPAAPALPTGSEILLPPMPPRMRGER